MHLPTSSLESIAKWFNFLHYVTANLSAAHKQDSSLVRVIGIPMVNGRNNENKAMHQSCYCILRKIDEHIILPVSLDHQDSST